jgi:hypothetical protein
MRPPDKRRSGPEVTTPQPAPTSKVTATDTATISPDTVVVLGDTMLDAVEAIARQAEIDDADRRWWYEFGRQVGIGEGRAQVDAELREDWLQRRRIAPSVSLGPCFCELQRRRRGAA